MTHRSKTPTGVVLLELDKHDIEAEVIQGKHMKIRYYVDGQKYTYTVPVTSGDGQRCLKNCRAGIRRLLRKAGITA